MAAGAPRGNDALTQRRTSVSRRKPAGLACCATQPSPTKADAPTVNQNPKPCGRAECESVNEATPRICGVAWRMRRGRPSVVRDMPCDAEGIIVSQGNALLVGKATVKHLLDDRLEARVDRLPWHKSRAAQRLHVAGVGHA